MDGGFEGAVRRGRGRPVGFSHSEETKAKMRARWAERRKLIAFAQKLQDAGAVIPEVAVAGGDG